MSGVKIKVQTTGMKDKVKDVGKIAQEAVSVQIAVNSNEFIPKDTGVLESSVFADSDFAKGKIIWSPFYAAFVYYNTVRNMKMNKGKNPNASTLWFEVARTRYLNDWVKLVNNIYKKEL